VFLGFGVLVGSCLHLRLYEMISSSASLARRSVLHGACYRAARRALASTSATPSATPSTTPSNVQPLAGVKVVDLTRVLAGPLATMMLVRHSLLSIA
jgi:hypothetical protein